MCKPKEEYTPRYAAVLEVLQGRATQAAQADEKRRKQNHARHLSDGLSDVERTLLMKPSQDEVDEQWARALIKKGLAIDSADDNEFRKAVLYTARAGLSYVDAQQADTKLPRRNKFSKVTIPALDKKLDQKVAKRIG